MQPHGAPTCPPWRAVSPISANSPRSTLPSGATPPPVIRHPTGAQVGSFPGSGVFTQPVPGTQASLVQGSLSLQSSAPGVFTQPVPSTQASLVQGSLSLQSRAPGVLTQPVPATQASLVQGSLSLQSSAPGVFTQPVPLTHASVVQ